MSYSMAMDDDGHEPVLGSSPDSTLQIRPRAVEGWIDDDAVSACALCDAAFGWFQRKHHCRCCGRIFCAECSAHRDQLPRDLERYPSGSSAWLQLAQLGLLGRAAARGERTCSKCHLRLMRTRYVWNDVRVFDLIELDLRALRTLGLVCKRWCRAVVCSLSAFREIQYRLPVQALSDRERRQLWINRRELSGHSLWCWQLLRAYPQDALLPLIAAPRRATCREAMCTRRCAPQLSAEDALFLLLVPCESARLRSYAIGCLGAAPPLYMLPHLVHALRYELAAQAPPLHSLLALLLRQSAASIAWRRQLFWLLRVEAAQCYAAALQRLLAEQDCTLLQAGVAALREMPVETLCVLPVFDETVLGIEIDKVKTKHGASQPKVWPCRVQASSGDSQPQTRNMLCKTQEMRSDLIVMSVIRYMDRVLRDEEQLDLGIVTYEVMPTGAQSGVLAMVQAKTLNEIQARGSILNYMLQHNGDARVAELRQRFIKSTAAYCVITYLLGIGDRHLENIMMTRDGRLFHVDFSFLLGSDPKPYAAPAMRLSEGMVEAIGGVGSPEYAEFQLLCTRIYNCLRRHVLPITTLLLLVPCDEQRLKTEILARFVPGENRIEAQLQLTSKIEDSRSSYRASAIDFLHAHGQTLSIRRFLGFLYDD